MPASTENTAARPLGNAKDRPARELVVAGFFGPLADRVALALVPMRVPPPAVVLANAAAGFAAALALQQGAPILAALLLQLKTFLDNADGQLARVSGRASLLGRYLDTEADLAVNVALFAALGYVTGQPWLALAAFCALTLVLSTSFNLAELYLTVHGRPAQPPLPSGGAAERALERFYRVVYAPQDRILRGVSERRLERILDGEGDTGRRRDATLAYYDRTTMTILANLGLSTQLVVLGACLALAAPLLYLWLVLGSVLLLPLLQLRRERLARRELSARRAA